MAENLPIFVIHEISARLPCEMDRLHMALACRWWRQALALQDAPPLLRRLPWLVFPFVEGPNFCCIACGGGVQSTTHRVRAPEHERRARYFGSHDGRWLLLAASRLGVNMATNVRSGFGYCLPDKSVDLRGEINFGMYIHAAALSCSPDKPNCIGAAVVQYLADLRAPRRVAFFTVGDGGEYAVDPLPEDFDEDPEDIIHFDGAFHVLTSNEHVHSWKPIFSNNGDVRLDSHHYIFCHDGRFYDEHVYGRYLVQSRGELLMGVKLSPDFDSSAGFTSGFRLFRMARMLNLDAVAGMTYCYWEELPDLDGRMMFLGRGCSRCYEVNTFPGFTDSVYFADDRTFHYSYRIVHDLPFPCVDNGRCIGQGPVDRCFPMYQGTSDYSSPVWLLP